MDLPGNLTIWNKTQNNEPMDNCVGQWWEALGPNLPRNNLEKKDFCQVSCKRQKMTKIGLYNIWASMVTHQYAKNEKKLMKISRENPIKAHFWAILGQI